jgi:hypothetical protein
MEDLGTGLLEAARQRRLSLGEKEFTHVVSASIQKVERALARDRARRETAEAFQALSDRGELETLEMNAVACFLMPNYRGDNFVQYGEVPSWTMFRMLWERWVDGAPHADLTARWL